MKLFRRRIAIVHAGNGRMGEARAVLEDDFHHFQVWVRYRGGVVFTADGSTLRSPYTACGDAVRQLDTLAGMPLAPVANSVTRSTDARLQCTHMLDLAGLAIAAAARGIRCRAYDIEIPRRTNGCTVARLYRDSTAMLYWEIDGDKIVSPAPYTGIGLREGMARWALATLGEEAAEAALVLRRCVIISQGRERDLDLQSHANSTGNCYAQQPERAPHAKRIVGSTLDFTTRPQALCAADHEFLDTAALRQE